MTYTNHDKAECAHREVGQRKRVYPRFVAGGQMTPAFAARQLELMTEIRNDYRRLAQADAAAATPSLDLQPATLEPPEWAYRAVDAYWTHQNEPLSGRLSNEFRRRMAFAVHAAILATPVTNTEAPGPADHGVQPGLAVDTCAPD